MSQENKLPTIKGYCKDCRKCTEYQGALICEGVVIGIIVIKDSEYVEPNDYCSYFEPENENKNEEDYQKVKEWLEK